MPYIQRDKYKQISGVFANKQPGYAEEFLADDNPELAAFLGAQSTPEPLCCTPLQARLALLNAGLLTKVNDYIDGLSVAQKLAWEYASSIEQSDEIVKGATEALGLQKDQVTALFEAAKKL